MAADVRQLRLLKVPRWLSEEWARAPPGGVVADLNIEAGTLRLLEASGSDGEQRPVTLRIARRAPPELIAFHREAGTGTAEGGEHVKVEGAIKEVLHAQVDLRDPAYMEFCQKRAEKSSITFGETSIAAGSRSEHGANLINRQPMKASSEVETIVGEDSPVAAATAREELIKQLREAMGDPVDIERLRQAIEIARSATRLADSIEREVSAAQSKFVVATAAYSCELQNDVARCLLANAGTGITCNELIAQLLPGSDHGRYLAVRDALVSLAEYREPRFFPSRSLTHLPAPSEATTGANLPIAWVSSGATQGSRLKRPRPASSEI